MARPKKPENELKENVGVRASLTTIKELEDLAASYGETKAWVARKLLLFGLTTIKSMAQSGVEINLSKIIEEGETQTQTQNEQIAA